MIEGIIFDIDGTLIRTEMTFIERTLRKTIKKLGDGYFNREHVSHFWWGGNGISREEILQVEFGVGNPTEFFRTWDSVWSPEEALKYKSAYDDVQETLDSLSLRGIPLGIVTDAPSYIAIPAIQSLLPVNYFSEIMTIGDTDGINSKPDPRGLQRCASELGVSPERVLYVGDSHNDLLGSRNAGMPFAWMNRGEHEIYGTPNRELKDLRELLS